MQKGITNIQYKMYNFWYWEDCMLWRWYQNEIIFEEFKVSKVNISLNIIVFKEKLTGGYAHDTL